MFVFLLGAGFSAGFSPPGYLPVMSRFMATADSRRTALIERESHSQDSGDLPTLLSYYKALSDFVSEYENSRRFLNRDWGNIEEIYTQAHLLELLGLPDQHRATATAKAIAWTIWDVYSRFTNNFRSSLRGTLETLGEFNSTPLSPAFITTNYDLMIEWSWWTEFSKPEQRINRLYYPGFEYWESADPNHVMAEIPVHKSCQGTWLRPVECHKGLNIPLIKLHGSANWFQVDGDNGNAGNDHADGFCAFPKWVAMSKFRDKDSSTFDSVDLNLAAKGVSTHVTSSGSNTVSIRPAIIPPLLGKATVPPMIQRQWRAAVECISRARYLAIIGYSFPPSDMFMSRLLTEGLKENDDLQHVWVVDSKQSRLERDEWQSKIARLFCSDLSVTYKHAGASDFFDDLVKNRLTSDL